MRGASALPGEAGSTHAVSHLSSRKVAHWLRHRREREQSRDASAFQRGWHAAPSRPLSIQCWPYAPPCAMTAGTRPGNSEPRVSPATPPPSLAPGLCPTHRFDEVRCAGLGSPSSSPCSSHVCIASLRRSPCNFTRFLPPFPHHPLETQPRVPPKACCKNVTRTPERCFYCQAVMTLVYYCHLRLAEAAVSFNAWSSCLIFGEAIHPMSTPSETFLPPFCPNTIICSRRCLAHMGRPHRRSDACSDRDGA
jgi:hypothetical protein